MELDAATPGSYKKPPAEKKIIWDVALMTATDMEICKTEMGKYGKKIC